MSKLNAEPLLPAQQQPTSSSAVVPTPAEPWCKGTITDKIIDRRRTINKDQINFKAEFDIDKGDSTDLSLGLGEYDTSPSADYQSWLLLAPASGEASSPAALTRE